MNVLITGGCGFIGSNFVRYMVERYPTYTFINLDALTYAGNAMNLEDINERGNYHFVEGNICDSKLVDSLIQNWKVEVIVNMAAESHVDRSISEPSIFVQSNVLGTQVLLEAARRYDIGKFVQVSTDEVYGSLEKEGLFTEETPLSPNSPYSASKASGDLLARSYGETFGLHVNITRCSNNYGPFQYPEKLIPLMITNAFEGKSLPIYGDGSNVRDWLHVEDHCRAIDAVIHKGQSGEVYNIGGNNEWTNLNLVKKVVEIIGASEELITFVTDRAGHDQRYAIDHTKITKELGWKPTYTFEEGLKETISWYYNHDSWWKVLKENPAHVTSTS
jgi:dTDP-glucose 4,6-dehydratase